MLQWVTMGEKLSERITIPVTPTMKEQLGQAAAYLGLRSVDLGRIALMEYLTKVEKGRSDVERNQDPARNRDGR